MAIRQFPETGLEVEASDIATLPIPSHGHDADNIVDATNVGKGVMRANAWSDITNELGLTDAVLATDIDESFLFARSGTSAVGVDPATLGGICGPETDGSDIVLGKEVELTSM